MNAAPEHVQLSNAKWIQNLNDDFLYYKNAQKNLMNRLWRLEYVDISLALGSHIGHTYCLELNTILTSIITRS